MRFRVTNIRPGYCEVWANTFDGGRYDKLAEVKQKGVDGWCWDNYDWQPGIGGFMGWGGKQLSKGFKTRRECIIDCKRTALLRQAQRAIDGGKGLSREYWHCPCRNALWDMQRSHLFSIVEMHEMRERMEASGKEQE